jgi:sphinganine-1-phosphate aldolase
MSADIHKYGLGIKGASVVLYRDEALRRYQIFAYAEWPGGLFGSPSMAGSRPGGIIAASWAILQAMGVDGYTEMARKLMDVTVSLKQGISDIPGLEVCGSPVMTAFSVRSCDSQVSIFAVADVMEKNGWTMERQMDSLHFSILPSHTPERAQQLLSALRQAVITVKVSLSPLLSLDPLALSFPSLTIG